MNDRVAALRAEFDRSFALPHPPAREPGIQLLLVSAGDRRLALCMDELERVLRAPRIVELPGAAPGLAGLAAVAGRLVVVADLGLLLGQRERVAPTYVATSRTVRGLAVGFSALEGRGSLPSVDGAHESTPVIIEGAARTLLRLTPLLRRFDAAKGPQ